MAASVALLGDGNVWAWGSNAEGQLGTGGETPDNSTPGSSAGSQRQACLQPVRSCTAKQRSGKPDPFR